MIDYDEELRERLAAVSHEIWAHWMNYLFDQCRVEINLYGSPITVIPDDMCIRWRRQIDSTYHELTESEKDSDREQADKIIAALRKAGYEAIGQGCY